MGDASITCGNCGTVNEPGASYCRECGALLAAYASPAGARPVEDAETRSMAEATAPPAVAAPTGAPPAASSEDVPLSEPALEAMPDDRGSVDAEPLPDTEAATDSPTPVASSVVEAPPEPDTTPTLAGTLGSGAVGPVGAEPPAVPSDDVTASEREPMVEPVAPPSEPAAEGDRIGRLDAGATEMGVEDGGPAPRAASRAAPGEPTAVSEEPPVAAWTVPPPSPASVPPPMAPEAPTGSGGGAFGAGDRLATMTGATPRTILTVAGVLILASCVILAADLPGYLTLLSLCAGPVGFILLIVGAVMLLTQRPERRF